LTSTRAGGSEPKGDDGGRSRRGCRSTIIAVYHTAKTG
jgi:hypothetical protein